MTKLIKEALFLELKPLQIIQNGKLIFLLYLKDQNNKKSWLVLLINLRAVNIFMESDKDLTLRPIVHYNIKTKKLVTIRMGIQNFKHKN